MTILSEVSKIGSNFSNNCCLWKYVNLSKNDLFNHVLVPKHIILNQDEIITLLSTYRIKPYQLPHIKASDPAVRAINGKLGDVVMIIRKSSTSGETVSYRYIIEG